MSAWIKAPAAFRLAGILSGEGKDKARTRMLYMFRDGAIVPRGQVNTAKGPEHVTLDTSWWINLEYREGANIVLKRDNLLYAHTDDQGRQIPQRTPGELPPGIRASIVEVRRTDIFDKFCIPSAPRGTTEARAGTATKGRKSFSQANVMRWLKAYRGSLNGGDPDPQPALLETVKAALRCEIGEKSFRELLRDIDNNRGPGQPALLRERGKRTQPKSAG
jgi:hypothetical protein